MKKNLRFWLAGLILLLGGPSRADEGMWLPFLIHQMNIGTMTQMGLRLTAEDIYSVNQASLKDAIVALDHGSCTGEVISKDGLVLTNHHCGYGEIQSHSTVENDYLTDGFWAMTREQELANPGKTMSFLIRMEDVTARVNQELTEAMTEAERNAKIAEIAALIEEEAAGGSHYEAVVETFFDNNFFYLFVYETFRDIRLVGAPPSAIGKFGGDTDNWMWPRHTGDFSLFRIYCGPDGKPADYSPQNVPYHPKYALPISAAGAEEGDFAMVMGYPGSTDRYLTSWGVRNEMDLTNSIRVQVRTEKLAILRQDMDASDRVRIMYASKYAQSANYWKYSMEQNKALAALDVVAGKTELEEQFHEWVNEAPDRKRKYGEALELIENNYRALTEFNRAFNYWFEALYLGSEVIQNGFSLISMQRFMEANPDDQETPKQIAQGIAQEASATFKDYNAPTDQRLLASLLRMYHQNVDPEFHLSINAEIMAKYKGDYAAYAKKLFEGSFLVDSTRYKAFLAAPSLKAMNKDMGFLLVKSAADLYFGLQARTEDLELKLARGKRLFAAGLLEMQADQAHYPNANSTMRLTYGSVGGYNARDAVYYKYFTTTDGILQKADSTSDEFTVPQRLIDLIEAKDFGRWANDDGTLQVCFLTNNDITGGNSGSPVINGKGQLIGCAFDGNSEAMSGDIMFEPELQKTICVDIRYVLFVIDKYAGASHLIEEMEIVE